MKCNNCGKEINELSKFCGFCGAAVVKDYVAPTTEKNTSEFTNQNPTISFAPVGDESKTPDPNQPTTPENKEKDRKKLLIILVSVLAGLLVILLTLLLVGNLSGDGSEDNNSSITTLEDMDSNLFRFWYLTAGEEGHLVEITSDGYLTIHSDSAKVKEKFTPISKTKLSIITNDGTTFTFELLGNTLVRQKNGKPDGYVYGPMSNGEEPETEVSSTPQSQVENTNNTVSEAPKNIVYSEQELSDAIKAYENFTNYFVCCDLGEDVTNSEIYDLLSDDQKSVLSGIYETNCCKTKSQAKTHLGKYIDPKVYGSFNSSSLLEHNGKLYILTGAVGFISYNANPDQFVINRTDTNKVSVTTTQYNSGGEVYCNTRFDFEYKNGRYKIVKVTDI